MVIYVDYFTAPSDDAAAAAIGRPEGPAPTFDTVRTELGPEMLVALEELLTDVSYQDHTPDTVDGRILASHNEDDLLVLAVAPAAQRALAKADGHRLTELAMRWSQVHTLAGQHNDSDQLLGILEDLQALARRAIKRRQRLYCWMCA